MIIGMANQKGGVGKTTLSVNIAAAFSNAGHRTLLLDVDPQGSSLDWSAARQGDSLFNVIGLPRATVHKEITSLARGYDCVIIDGPPRVTDLARSVIMASHIVLIPVQPSPYDVWAAEDVVKLIHEASVFKEKLKSGFVINRKIANTAIGRDVGDALSNFDIPMLSASVAQRVSFAETAAQGKTIFESDDTKAIAEIQTLFDEIVRM